MRNTISGLFMAFFLTACIATSSALVQPGEVKIDPRVLQPCADLIALPENATFEILLNVAIANIEIYYDCRTKQNTSITVIKDFANKE